jgi:hypothetical protein
MYVYLVMAIAIGGQDRKKEGVTKFSTSAAYTSQLEGVQADDSSTRAFIGCANPKDRRKTYSHSYTDN